MRSTILTEPHDIRRKLGQTSVHVRVGLAAHGLFASPERRTPVRNIAAAISDEIDGILDGLTDKAL